MTRFVSSIINNQFLHVCFAVCFYVYMGQVPEIKLMMMNTVPHLMHNLMQHSLCSGLLLVGCIKTWYRPAKELAWPCYVR